MLHLHSFPTRRSSDLFNLELGTWNLERRLFNLELGTWNLEPKSSIEGGRSADLRTRRRGGRSAARSRDCLRDCSRRDRKSTRLNSSHANISYAVFCLK